jgi:hypothetical protein
MILKAGGFRVSGHPPVRPARVSDDHRHASSVDRLAWHDQGVALRSTSRKPGRSRRVDHRNHESHLTGAVRRTRERGPNGCQWVGLAREHNGSLVPIGDASVGRSDASHDLMTCIQPDSIMLSVRCSLEHYSLWAVCCHLSKLGVS